MTADRRWLSGLCVALVVLATFVGVVSLPALAQPTTEATNATTNATATFNRSVVTEQRGDIASIELDLNGTPNATVTVGSRAVNYETNVTVNDSNGDGRVDLLMNTYTAGTGENDTGVYATTDNDTVVATNRSTARLDAPLETSSYNLSVGVDGARTDTATLDLVQRTTGGLVTWTSPAADFANTTTAGEVATAVRDGHITTTDTVAAGDVLVNQFKLSGIYGALAATNFSHLVGTGALNFAMVQTNPGTNRPPKRLDLDASLANDSITVIPDPANDVLYVDLNTTRAVFDNGSLAPGDEYESTLSLDGNSSLADHDESLSSNVTVVGPQLGLGDLALDAATNQTVSGETSVAPGSRVTVRVQHNDTGAFVKTNTTTVKPNGTFTADVNLSDVAARTPVDVAATGPLNTSDTADTTVRPAPTNTSTVGNPSVTFPDQSTTGDTVVVRNVTLPAGGFVVIHARNASAAPVGSVLGASSYLENGTTRNVTVTLDRPLARSSRLVAMVHRDTNENEVYDFSSSNGSQDGPYTVGGRPVTATARVTVDNATTGVPSASATNATRTVTAANDTETGTNASGASTTSEPGPGFGVALVFLALAAVLVGLLARRRR